ncbi:Ankyrin repeat domain-containing protein 50 [Geodia barretti]|uniref:Ankyrin repeat domain-containing protein 50 n=1 Tax=Geodia barretti TaxID=519541 RepID=A0AA35WLI1_GEOBA|nr:Ankyrin repeat domain-containing protein 50 [Geodia barretti]
MGAESSKQKTKDPNDISLSLRGLYGYHNVVIHTAQVLGSGAYGNVVKATLDKKPCAAKILHRVIVDSQDPGLPDFISRFEQECQILRDLKHPNIVQFLGVVQDPTTNKPILLMEMMKDSLTHFLESSATDIPYHVQVNISHDIALAVAHLHRNGILHRDLSSNNVLLSASHQAKVTDFGMSKIAASNPSMTRSKVTQCPGTLVYMPPEALRPQPRYSDKIDTFSIGVLLLQIVTRTFPAPTAASTTREDPTSAWGEIDIPIPEVERRKSEIDKVPADSGFLPVVKDCLKDKSKDRPTAAQLCHSLGTLKSTAVYSGSLSAELLEGRTELHDAAERGDVKAVRKLLSTSVNINSRTEDEGDTALLVASCRGHVEVVRLLLEAGASVLIPDKNGTSPLYVASQEGHSEVVDVLVKAGADVNQAWTKESCSVPLETAAHNGHTETVQRLLEAGAIVNHQNKSGQTPVWSASLNGHTAVVQLLIENGADISICDKNGASPLYVASEYGHSDVVDILLQAGADVHKATTKSGSVPLGIAAKKGHTETVQRLLEAGANINYQNKDGVVPLGIAAEKGHTEAVQRLLEAGANVNHQNKVEAFGC